MLERLARRLGGDKIWAAMKRSAELASARDGGARYVAQRLRAFLQQAGAGAVRLHAVGHSAGSIFHAHFLRCAADEGVDPVATAHLLAPAIRVDLFKRTLAPLLGSRIGHLTMFTMKRDWEEADSVGPYGKSLLYLVSRALEPEPDAPILGLEECVQDDDELRALLGLKGARSEHAEVVWAVSEKNTGRSASTSRTHGGFDNDRATMNAILRRVLDIRDDAPLVLDFPAEAVSRVRLAAEAEPAPPVPPAQVAEVLVHPVTVGLGNGAPLNGDRERPGGARRALCIGIDQYDTSPLFGCVADARRWSETLAALGFRTELLLDAQATREAILGRIGDLLRGSKPGDVLVVQFSGHGTELPDLDGDEVGGGNGAKDEALCPYDFETGAYAIDDDLAETFATLPSGVNLTCFMDCCHSGTMTRVFVGAARAALRGARSRFLVATPAMEAAHERYRRALGGRRGLGDGRRGPEKMREVLFWACLDSEVALEYDGAGAFTVRATRLLQTGISGITHAEFERRLVASFADVPRAAPAARLRAERPRAAPARAARLHARRTGRERRDGDVGERREQRLPPQPDRRRAPAVRGAPRSAMTSTTPAAAQLAESRERGRGGRVPPEGPPPPGEGVDYDIGERVTRALIVRPYERKPDDPVYRPLRIYTRDANTPRDEGGIATVNVPFEPIERSPKEGRFGGRLVVVEASGDGAHPAELLDLDDPKLLMASGRDPSPADHAFHQQMVYAVCSLVYAAFRSALGRDLAWGFAPAAPDREARLVIVPHGCREGNAYYDRDTGTLRFGYDDAVPEVRGRNLPGGLVYTCLSHDVVAHEVAHALLDGLRADFLHPSNPDVCGLHEGFADLVAVFQRFTYREFVASQVRRSRGDLKTATGLTEIARQLGEAMGGDGSLRAAVERPGDAPKIYDERLEPHELGAILVGAVYEALSSIFAAKTRRYMRLATGGTGVLPPGEIPPDLTHLSSEEAVQLAHSFLTMCIRAIDYCPPVDVTFGAFLRAVVTADRDGDPARPAAPSELRRQAAELGRFVSQPHVLREFGLARNGDPRLGRDTVSRLCVQSIRASRRVGPDGQVLFDLIAEVTQIRHRATRNGERPLDFLGGATVIIGPDGHIRYSVLKSVLNEERLERQREYLRSDVARAFLEERAGRLVPARNLFRRLHFRRAARAAG